MEKDVYTNVAQIKIELHGSFQKPKDSSSVVEFKKMYRKICVAEV